MFLTRWQIMGAERRLPRLRVTWSLQEERTFIEAHSRLGNRWVEISKLLPGRDARSVTNHWLVTHTHTHTHTPRSPCGFSLTCDFFVHTLKGTMR